MAPSEYLVKLERGDKQTPAIDPERLDGYLASHLIDPVHLRSDNFDAFMVDRQKRLLALIEQAMGKPAYTGDVPEEGLDVGGDDEAAETDMLLT